MGTDRRDDLIELLLERYGIENDGTLDDHDFAIFQQSECERLADAILALLAAPSGDLEGQT